MADEWHVRWLREGVKQWNKRRKKVKFTPKLAGVNFYDLLPPDFRDSPKTSRFFEKIDLRDADLRGAKLSNLNFAGAKFDRASLIEADLSKTNFSSASFLNSDLSAANAQNAVFLDADFRRADFQEFRLENSDLSGALIFETNVTEQQMMSANSVAAIRSYSDFQMFKGPIQTLLKTLTGTDQKAKPEPKISFDVMYATNRCPIYVRQKLEGFDGLQNTSLSYGVCEVTLEDAGRVGTIGSSLWRRIFSAKAKTEKITATIEYSEQLFWDYFAQVHGRMKNPTAPTMFIHGFNTDFEASVVRAARVGHGLGLGQGISLFSWPSSGGGIHNYVSDLNTVEASKYDLADFIEKFASNSPVGKINIIAHSMGCRLLVSSVEILANKSSPWLNSIDNLVLAAADVDTRVARRVAPIAFGKFGRFTSYVTDDDLALVTSASVGKYDRVGLVPPVFTHAGIDTIQVDGEDGTMLRHGYIATSRALLNDMFYLIKNRLPPSHRHKLVQKKSGMDVYWLLQP